MAIKFDNIHWNSRRIDSYDKDINFIFGPREPGKTTYMWVKRIYEGWKKDKRPWIYMVRKSVEINEALIDSIFDTNINKFTDDCVEVEYNKGSFKEGIVDVKINKEIFFRIVSLNIDLRRIKLAILRNAKSSYMDEYIINPRNGEKYLKDEWYKIKEAYTTWRRECEGKFKMYFTGNPYSLYNPIFVGLGIDLKKLRKGEILVGPYYAIEWVVISSELKEWLLKVNPFYQFDEDYSEYALEGTAINDKNIKLSNMPKDFALNMVIRYQGEEIGIYRNKYYDEFSDSFYISKIKGFSKERRVFCFDFEDIVGNTCLISYEDRMRFASLKKALQRNKVAFESIPIYYLIVEIYTYI